MVSGISKEKKSGRGRKVKRVIEEILQLQVVNNAIYKKHIIDCKIEPI